MHLLQCTIAIQYWCNWLVPPFQISFASLDWQDAVITPPGFTANFCAGHCEWPPASNSHYNKHAFIQSYASFLDPSGIPPPCCAPVPDSFLKISVVLRVNQDIVVRPFPNMVATRCVCIWGSNIGVLYNSNIYFHPGPPNHRCLCVGVILLLFISPYFDWLIPSQLAYYHHTKMYCNGWYIFFPPKWQYYELISLIFDDWAIFILSHT